MPLMPIPEPKPKGNTRIGVKLFDNLPNGGFFATIDYKDDDGKTFYVRSEFLIAGGTYGDIPYSYYLDWDKVKRVEHFIENNAKALSIEAKERAARAQASQPEVTSHN